MKKGMTMFELNSRISKLEEIILHLPEKTGTVNAPNFDWQTVHHCTMCHKDIPALIAEIHNHIKHGI